MLETIERGIGDNRAPSLFDFARETMDAIGKWLSERPVVDSDADAREAKLLLDRAKGVAGDLEAERISKVAPLNEELDLINGQYKEIHNTDRRKPGLLDKVVSQLKTRLEEFIIRETQAKEAEAALLRERAQEAEAKARAAEMAEREAIENAKNGELGVDVTPLVIGANERFSEFKKADREALRAERETHVKIGGGWGNAASLRNKETLVLVNYGKAITAIGKNEKIETAILSAARDYRKLHDRLPDGVESIVTKGI